MYLLIFKIFHYQGKKDSLIMIVHAFAGPPANSDHIADHKPSSIETDE